MVRAELRKHWSLAGSGELVRYSHPRPDVPRPPRSRAPAVWLALAAAALVAVSVVAGIFLSPAVFGVFFVLGLATTALAVAASATAARGHSSLAYGLIPLPPAEDLTEYYLAYAGQIFHRRYVRPQADLDPDALATWRRAVDAANRIYRAECLRERVVDTNRVTAEVPELLWKIAEGLAKISDVRFDLRQIVLGPSAGISTSAGVGTGTEQLHPVVEAKVKAQERDLARSTRQVGRRIDRLETLASRLAAADGARRGEELLKRLREVDPKIRDLVASTSESVTEVDMAEGLKLDVEAIIAMTNQAISDLFTQDEDDDPTESPQRT